METLVNHAIDLWQNDAFFRGLVITPLIAFFIVQGTKFIGWLLEPNIE